MKLEVHVDLEGTPSRVGRLFAERGQSVTFEYDQAWLQWPDAFAIDPTSLPLQRGPHHGARLFGALQDCGPDRWGRVLVDRAVRKQTLPQQPYRDVDYLLALDDSSRIGALRFRHEGGPFLAATTGRLPPVVRLNSLLAAADAVHRHTETAADLRFLLGEGSPLGGARPKSAVLLADGRLGIAKFPRPDDTRDVAAGEVLALAIAASAGVRTAEHKLVAVGKRSVALITRFDRDGSSRFPFLSAASLLGIGADGTGAYTMIADVIRQWGHSHADDLRELWRRMVFSLLASNTDDHLRNHGFLMRAPGKWQLAPAYDLNPVPEIERAQESQTPISEEPGPPSIAAALAAAPRFLLDRRAARKLLAEVAEAVGQWRTIGRQLRIPKAVMDGYRTAFEHELADEARTVLRA